VNKRQFIAYNFIMEKYCPICHDKMIALFTSYVCDTCNPINGEKLLWKIGYVPLLDGKNKSLEGLLIDSIFSTPEKAKDGIETYHSSNPQHPRWSILKVKFLANLPIDNPEGELFGYLTFDVQNVILMPQRNQEGYAYVHFIEEIRGEEN
jgi:hypothetical protein